MIRRVLFLSNGHGEDLNGSLILQALQRQDAAIAVAAMPIVGTGNAYRRLGVEIVGPTQQLPSSGFNYINLARLLNPINWRRDQNPLNLVRDLLAGLLALTWGQLRAVQRYSLGCELLFVTGDVVPILFAYLTRQPFMVFLVSTSSYYEGQIKLPLLAQLGLRSPRCLKIFTRDAYTARDLHRRGFAKARYAGYPIMDVLTPTGKDLGLKRTVPTVALLPGSRLPEALENFALLLQFCDAIGHRCAVQFQAALVPGLDQAQLRSLAERLDWQLTSNSLHHHGIEVRYHYDGFADILHSAQLVMGMAGTAVEQAVGLGKPVIQLVGEGPQFTYPFAEAQQRLLGPSVITIGTRSATPNLIRAAAEKAEAILQDSAYLEQCVQNGQERVGGPGGAAQIAAELLEALKGLG
ncbi:hypothetical protein C7271_02460 [filamentous cyanobacterium CCP5]|nr:hypothetical protein C7271_02460 [filamentous cyanobacterium CCP5]